uniref:Si:ch211-154o6.3 n=1 Tax=Scleropages formosus TaxID=113540 RepID=A0A8C9RZA7_SCLFO
MGEVRKVQKKLRQIENLEIKASLTKEERDKVEKWKEELRSRLAELLLQLSAPQRDQGIVGDEKEKMKRRILVSRPPPTKVLKEGSEKRTGQEKEDTHETETQDYPSRVQIDTRLKSLRASWEGSKFRLRLLEGHNDLVTCVVAVDNMVVSGSRDTTVKVWHVPTATEQRNLGGHSGGVTCLFAPLPEYCRRLARSLSLNEKERFVISGSVDCTVRIWALSTGLCVKSIYTFNAVSTLCFVPEGEGFIVTGSDGGKVEVWSWDSMQNCQSVKAHEDSVTTLQSQGPLVFSGSADGGVSVWEVHHSSPAPLQILHRWSSCVTGCGSPNEAHVGQLALSPRGDRVFLADGKANLKILNWRTGSVSRLANHSTVAGVTDCVSQTAGILIGSCFDLATGDSTLNLFSLPQCEYLVSLTCHEYPRILCFAAWLTPSGGHRWVTGGRVLTVWEQLPTSTKQSKMHFFSLSLSLSLSDDDMDNYISQDAPANDEEPNSSWLRCALQ